MWIQWDRDTYVVRQENNETGAIFFFLFNIYLYINIIPFKVVHLGSHTPPETLFPLPVAVLEVFM